MSTLHRLPPENILYHVHSPSSFHLKIFYIMSTLHHLPPENFYIMSTLHRLPIENILYHVDSPSSPTWKYLISCRLSIVFPLKYLISCRLSIVSHLKFFNHVDSPSSLQPENILYHVDSPSSPTWKYFISCRLSIVSHQQFPDTFAGNINVFVVSIRIFYSIKKIRSRTVR